MGINGINGQTPMIPTPQVAGETQVGKASGGAPVNPTLTVGEAQTSGAVAGSQAPALEPATPPSTTQLSDTIAALSSSKSVFFSAFAILQLLRECAQEERQTARMARQSELLVEQNAISAQADKMRTEGILGLAIGIVGSVISGGMAIGSAVAGVKALGTKVQMQSQANLPELASQAATSMGEVKTAQANLTTAKTEIVEAQIQARHDQLAGVPQVTQEQVTQAQTELQQLQDNPPAQLQDPDMATLTPEQRQRLDAAAGQPNEAQVKAEITQEQNTARAAAHNTRVQEAQQNLTAKTQGKAAYDQAQADLHDLEENPPTEVDRQSLTQEQKTRLETAEKAETDAKTKFRMDETEYRAAKEELEENPDYIKTEKTIKTADVVQTVANTLSQVFNSVTTGANSLLQAQATAEQSIQKEAESHQQDENDMMKVAGDLQDTVLQTLQAIYQAETQSFRNIMA